MRLPQEFLRLTEQPRGCSYLPGERAALECRLFPTLTPRQLEYLLIRGWRRFGMEVFRPACPLCSKCRPIRVPVKSFEATKSQRRILRRNADVRVTLGPASVSTAHVRLYNEWHLEMTELRNWTLQQTTPKSYAHSFLTGRFKSLHEMLYFRGDQLIGVGLIDVMPRSISSAYFFYDPHWRAESPGTYSALCEIQLAQQQGLDHLYLGYWIAECPSMAYKNRFQPYELLSGYPADDGEPVWELQPRE